MFKEDAGRTDPTESLPLVRKEGPGGQYPKDIPPLPLGLSPACGFLTLRGVLSPLWSRLGSRLSQSQ